PGTLFLIAGGLKAGIDFTGGSELTLRFKNVHPSTTVEDQIRRAVTENAKLSQVEVVSSTPFGGGTSSDARYLVRIPNIGNDPQKLAAIEAPLYQLYGCGKLVTQSGGSYKVPLPACQNVVLEQRTDVGPTIGQQIRNRAAIAVLIAA